MAVALLIFANALPAGAQVRLTFAADSAAYAPTAEWDQQIWDADDLRILGAMESVSGLRFETLDIQVIIYGGPSHTGAGESLPMHLNARYPVGMTLVHELGHRLNMQVRDRPPDLDDHRLLYLYLYDVWTDLYGSRFAQAAVAAERGWAAQGLAFIAEAWDWALSMTREERSRLLRELAGVEGGGCSHRTTRPTAPVHPSLG